ncbi:hypothetical protein [Planococcus sp. MB-3u-03]|uniref:hypothetical protein n=1 Tax=Planococcus sp. MB-3u-03 TaxID=2058136 RepID=UPI001E607D53|nr:hypothetical protein [Planococcus sp. MB-3u-03]
MNKLKSQQGFNARRSAGGARHPRHRIRRHHDRISQMTLFNNKTEAKLDTMNLARQEMANITNADWLGDRDEADPVIYENSSINTK